MKKSFKLITLLLLTILYISKAANTRANEPKPEMECTNNLPLSLNFFVKYYNQKSMETGSGLPITQSVNRITQEKFDYATFCPNEEILCFTVVWEKNRERIKRLAMYVSGDQTAEFNENIFNIVESFIYGINPNLTYEQTQDIIKYLPLDQKTVGTYMFVDQNQVIHRIEGSRTAENGLILMANAIDQANVIKISKNINNQVFLMENVEYKESLFKGINYYDPKSVRG